MSVEIQNRLYPYRCLGVVGQGGTSGIRAEPGVDLAVVIHTGRLDRVIGAVINGLGLILHILGVVDRAVLAGNGISQMLNIPQQSHVQQVQGIHGVIAVGGDGVAVCQIGVHIVVGVIAQIGGGGPFQRARGRCVRIGLGPIVFSRDILPVIAPVQNGGFGPVSIESQIGKGEGHLCIVGGNKTDPSFYIGAIFKILVYVGLVLIRERHRHGYLRGTAARHSHHVLVVVCGVTGRERVPGFRGLPHRLFIIGSDGFTGIRLHDRNNVIAESPVAGVMDGELHGVNARLVYIITQFQLGAVLVGDGEIRLGIYRIVDVEQPSALLPHGGRDIVAVHHLGGGAHQQGIDPGQLLRFGQLRKLLLYILLQNSHSACHMGRRHGRAVHVTVLIIREGRINVAARRCDFRFDGQVRSGAPGGEVGHLSANGVVHVAEQSRHRQGLAFLLQQEPAILLRDHGTGDIIGRNAHVNKARGVVIDQKPDGASVVRVGLFLLVVDFSPAHQSNLALHVNFGEILHRSVSGRYILQAFACQAAEQRRGNRGVVLAQFHRVVVGDVPAVHSQIRAFYLTNLLRAGHGEGSCISRGRTHVAVVRVPGQRMALAENRAESRAVIVTRRHSQVNPMLLHPVENRHHLQGFRVFGVVLRRAAGRTQGEVNHVCAQEHGILQSGQNVVIGRSASSGGKHLHGKNLRLRSNPFNLIGQPVVRGGNTGDVSAVIAAAPGIGAVGFIRIIKAIRNFLTGVNLRWSQGRHNGFGVEIILLQAGGNCAGIQLCVVRRIPERFVIQVNAAVHNCNNGPLAFITGLVGRSATNHGTAVAHHGLQFEFRCYKRCRHTVQLTNFLKLSVGDRGGKSIHQQGVMVFHIQGLSI